LLALIACLLGWWPLHRMLCLCSGPSSGEQEGTVAGQWQAFLRHAITSLLALLALLLPAAVYWLCAMLNTTATCCCCALLDAYHVFNEITQRR